MTRLNAPCKGCEKREVGCHATCEDYLTYRELKDEQNAELKEKAKREQEQNDIEKSRKKRIALGRFNRRAK